MHVAGCTDGFPVLLAERDDPAHEIPKILLRIALAVPRAAQHEGIVHDRLYFQVVVEVHEPGDLFIRGFVHQRAVQFSRLAGGSDDQSLAAFLQQALRDARPLMEEFQMRFGNQAVEIDASGIVLRQQDHVICKALLQLIDRSACRVVHEIALAAVDDLDGLSLLRTGFRGMHGVREGLDHAVVRDRDGFVTPGRSTLHEFVGMGDCVHLTHLGMRMEFHALFRRAVAAFVHRSFLFHDPADGRDRDLAVETVHGCDTLQADELILRNVAVDLLLLLGLQEKLDLDGVGLVRDHEDVQQVPGLQFTGLQADDLPLDHDVAHLFGDLRQCDRFFVKAEAETFAGLEMPLDGVFLRVLLILLRGLRLLPLFGFLLRVAVALRNGTDLRSHLRFAVRMLQSGPGVLYPNRKRKSQTLLKKAFQVLCQFRRLGAQDHAVRDGQHRDPFFGETQFGMAEQIVLHQTERFQFEQDAVAVGLICLLRTHPSQPEALADPHQDVVFREISLLDRCLQGIAVPFADQKRRLNIHFEAAPVPRHGHPVHKDLIHAVHDLTAGAYIRYGFP